MLWLLLLLAGGSFGENAAPTTAPSSFPDLATTTKILGEIVTNKLNLLETEVTERITTLVDDVTSASSGPTTQSPNQETTVSNDSIQLSRSLEQKKTELVSVPSSPVGPPLPSEMSTEDLIIDEVVDGFVDEARFLANHFVVEVPIYSLANATSEFIKSPRMAFGKSPFLTGFGLGFLAFGLKKLLLPLFIGAQIVKSVLVALFLPTILGHIGKLVGKGLTSVATQSGSSGGNHDQVAEFDFKDAGGGYGDAETAGSDTMSTWTMPAAAAPAQSNAHATLAALNPGRTPGVSQTAQDRPLDLVSTYLSDYANNAFAYSQGNYHNNPYNFYNNLMYGYYRDNTNGNGYSFDKTGYQANSGPQSNLANKFNTDVPYNYDSNRLSPNHGDSQYSKYPNYNYKYYNEKFSDYYGNYKWAQHDQKMPPGQLSSTLNDDEANSRVPEGGLGYTPRLPSHQIKQHFGSFYSKDPQSDFKVFNKIPSSSQLLTHYDPFYSPLLSRLDSVFKQLGTTSEGCRERLVCDMYRNPAKFAPFSNLVSAQLSRELNELRKPSSDNPEILRFFRYMKAAKDGQDGTKCEVLHNTCIAPTIIAENASPMVTTFNDINKLVHARKLDK